ncbi:HMG-box domain-containing protein [Sporobolomyces koalae]|uniref:HMG-box domain-containing protein n=1 Tax=Sporobolomyces koalae TaxID=500713 RepID=UPI00316DEB5C
MQVATNVLPAAFSDSSSSRTTPCGSPRSIPLETNNRLQLPQWLRNSLPNGHPPGLQSPPAASTSLLAPFEGSNTDIQLDPNDNDERAPLGDALQLEIDLQDQSAQLSRSVDRHSATAPQDSVDCAMPYSSREEVRRSQAAVNTKTSTDGLSETSPACSRPSYVRTFRIPSPSSPLNSSSVLSSSYNRPRDSPSLSTAVSILGCSPPRARRANIALFLPEDDDEPITSIFTTLDAAVEILRSPRTRPNAARSVDDSESRSSKRPHIDRCVTEPYPPTSSASQPKSPSRSKAKKKPDGYIPRAPNAWILYRSACIKRLAESGDAPKLQSDISKLVGSMWREESAEVKEAYAQQALIEAKLHAERFPGYSYKPSPSAQPRRKPSKKELGTGRARAKTTSSVAPTRSPNLDNIIVPSVLMPSPHDCGLTTSNVHDTSSYSLLSKYPYTPSISDTYDSPMPSTPQSSATEAWTMFQSSGFTQIDYTLPDPPYSHSGAPFSAPAGLSNFPFSFSQPPPILSPESDCGSLQLPLLDSTFSTASSTCSSYPATSPSYSPCTPTAQIAHHDDYLVPLPFDDSDSFVGDSRSYEPLFEDWQPEPPFAYDIDFLAV